MAMPVIMAEMNVNMHSRPPLAKSPTEAILQYDIKRVKSTYAIYNKVIIFTNINCERIHYVDIARFLPWAPAMTKKFPRTGEGCRLAGA
jgi:hypothetical protein